MGPKVHNFDGFSSRQIKNFYPTNTKPSIFYFGSFFNSFFNCKHKVVCIRWSQSHIQRSSTSHASPMEKKPNTTSATSAKRKRSRDLPKHLSGKYLICSFKVAMTMYMDAFEGMKQDQHVLM